MSRFPQIIKNGRDGYIALQSDIGLDILIQEFCGNISEANVSNEKISSDRVKREIDRWILSFETNPDTVSERQAVVSYAIENPDLPIIIKS